MYTTPSYDIRVVMKIENLRLLESVEWIGLRGNVQHARENSV